MISTGRRPGRDRTARGAAGPSVRCRRSRQARPARVAPAAMSSARACAVRVDRAAVGAGQPGRRNRHGRLRVRPGPRPLEAGARHGGPARGWPRLQHDRDRLVVRRDVRAAARPPQPAPGRPARHRPVGADRLPAAPGPEGRLRTRRGRLRRRPGRAGRRLLDRAVGRRPRRGGRRARARPGRRLRRLVRHLLRPGLRRPPPRAGPQRGARQRLPGVRRGRVVRHPGPGDARLLRARLRADPRLPRRRPAVPAHPGEGARGGARPSPGAARRTTRTAAG